MTDQTRIGRVVEDGDEPISNHSSNRHFQDILKARLSRRDVLKGGLAAAITGLFGTGLAGCGSPDDQQSGQASSTERPPEPNQVDDLLGFDPLPVSAADAIQVPEGYRATAILPWGTPITGDFPTWRPDNKGAQQAMQVGSHHDGIHFFPIEGKDPWSGSSEDGLLVMNHEYVEPRFLHASAAGMALDSSQYPQHPDGSRDSDQVLKEINAHGVSVVRVTRQPDGSWHVTPDPRNRRITGLTAVEIGGPVRGSELVRTRYSAEGTRARGTLNNCAHGVTPWNTYLAAEENWASYFNNDAGEQPREQTRYGVTHRRYAWHKADNGADEFMRFDVTPKGIAATDDYRNEANTFGWVVEIDPFDPESTPVKRTALGRFAHEGIVFAPTVEGRPIVCYSGDDARFEYIYKFVSDEPYYKDTAGGHLLDKGTLYVAKFNEDGTGEWLPLVFGEGPLQPQPISQGEARDCHCFKDQAEVLVNTRLAADLLGATKMDRPEWGAVDPKTGAVYFTLTNNTRRGEGETDRANPRARNYDGHIIRWREANDDHAGTTFEWEIFVLAGPADSGTTFAGAALDEGSKFTSPDGLWFDADARMWIQTDISESVQNQGRFEEFGNNAMLAANPVTGEIRRFLTGPAGQEITGVVTTPDQRTMFINVQHPGATTQAADFAKGRYTSNWPDGENAIPRSSTVVISRIDGGKVGAG
ncbi:MAG: PhoX family protein [Halothiobacillaceae bacterium]